MGAEPTKTPEEREAMATGRCPACGEPLVVDIDVALVGTEVLGLIGAGLETHGPLSVVIDRSDWEAVELEPSDVMCDDCGWSTRVQEVELGVRNG